MEQRLNGLSASLLEALRRLGSLRRTRRYYRIGNQIAYKVRRKKLVQLPDEWVWCRQGEHRKIRGRGPNGRMDWERQLRVSERARGKKRRFFSSWHKVISDRTRRRCDLWWFRREIAAGLETYFDYDDWDWDDDGYEHGGIVWSDHGWSVTLADLTPS